ncbi:hypothetical protein [Streptomyces sp. NPDC101249]|uniref:hypothetical protein n=1 Tax=Streptomyces sp. NPDC101249 TaxID=3366140 RepID=UPI003827DD47
MAAEYGTPLRITREGREALDSFLFQLTAAARRRVTISDAITAACTVASAHLSEAADALNAPSSGEAGTSSE